MKKNLKLQGVLLLFFFGVFSLLLISPESEKKLYIYSDSGKYGFEVELAQTPEEKMTGLMGRDFLLEKTGMLFAYDRPTLPVIWMKNMLISIDILFISDDLTIHSLHENAPPCLDEDDSLCPRYRAGGTSLYVLELPAGTISQLGIKAGDIVKLPSLF